jgi:hypothetical protein
VQTLNKTHPSVTYLTCELCSNIATQPLYITKHRHLL